MLTHQFEMFITLDIYLKMNMNFFCHAPNISVVVKGLTLDLGA